MRGRQHCFVRATAVLYDGSPFHPDGEALWDLADEAALAFEARRLAAARRKRGEPEPVRLPEPEPIVRTQ